MEFKVALIVGRFQPFHKGHLFLIKKALENADKIIIGIGSANITDDNNPIDFETRGKVIKAVFYKEGIKNKLIKIVPLDDFLDDKKWIANLKTKIGKFDLALGNNDWTNNILKKAGFKVLKVDYYKRGVYEGWRIRKLIKEGKKWENRVPDYIVKWLYGYMVEKKNNITIEQYSHVVLGGTFDHFHAGHKALITKAFEIGKKVIIGIATEEIYKNKFLSKTIEPFELRKKSVQKFAKNAKIISFFEFTGGADKQKEIDAIVVSRQTYPNALKINELRKNNRLKPLQIIIIEDVLAEDGKLISSERIRAGEIDREGKKYQISNIKNQKEIIMPEGLRPTLQKPLGIVFKNVGAIRESPFFNSSNKPTILIAVGDIIVDSLLKEGIDPDVKVIDFRSRRERTDLFTGSVLIRTDPIRSVPNRPGTINLKTAEKLRQMIQERSVLNQDGPYNSWLVVEGEEDLLTLPAILFAPLGSLVLYGHWQHGIIAVEVDEEMKDRVRKIIKKFS